MWMTVVDITNARGNVVCVSGISLDTHTHKLIRTHTPIQKRTHTHTRSKRRRVCKSCFCSIDWRSHNLFFPVVSLQFISFAVCAIWQNCQRALAHGIANVMCWIKYTFLSELNFTFEIRMAICICVSTEFLLAGHSFAVYFWEQLPISPSNRSNQNIIVFGCR